MTARILIVDDVPANARLLEAKLTAEYYQVASAGDGFGALDLARGWQPDVILLDVMMPGMDGFECCRGLKAHSATLHIPIIMITALGEPSERLRGLEAGADEFITKPVEFNTLMARIRSLIRLKRLLDECRTRSETARVLGLVADQTLLLPVKGARTLVVDDWEITAQKIQAALRRHCIVPVRAHDEADVWALTASTRFDLIILSLCLSQQDALKLLSGLRAADLTHELPIMLIADPDERDRVIKGFELGANDCLVLPLDQNELRARVRNLIRRKFYQDRLRSDLGSALEMALTDPLTGLHNRGYLRQYLNKILEGGAGRKVCLVMIDIDHFKMLNDRFGHIAGDRALQLIAQKMRENVRVCDILARYGGEEFAVVMPNTNAEDAVAVAERLRTAVADAKFEVGQGEVANITISLGVSSAGEEMSTMDSLLRRADDALYEAKRKGRNRMELASLRS
jgi:two-component system, cell cycle response regulator